MVCLAWLLSLAGCAERQLVRPTPQMDAEPQYWIKVLLLDDIKTCTFKAPSPWIVSNPPAAITQHRFGRVEGPVKITISAGKINIDGRAFESNVLIIAPDHPYIFNINGQDYRGKLKIVLGPKADSFKAINLVPLEPYLAGVIGAEMPNYWEPAALRAQAIAARTYCLYIKRHFGDKRPWDVTKTAANQVYRGIAVESAQTWDAVNKTKGRVLVCRQSDGSSDLFPAYYSSACGGHTENSKYVFGDSFRPLAGVACPYCRDVTKPSFFFWPMVAFDKDAVTKTILQRYPKLKHLGRITNITAVRQSSYEDFSRLLLVKLVGSTGKSGFLRAEDLRLSIDPTGNKLRSTICQIVNMQGKWAFLSGRGYGHGVGMCQCGAQGMARKAKSTTQILLHYYPDSEIVRLY